MILNQPQAEAIYSAICALNNVSANQGVELRFVGGNDGDYNRYGVKEEADGEVTVYVGGGLLGRERETYQNQASFAAAYGLDGKQPRTAVYTAGIGWQVKDKHGRRGNYETEAEALAA